MALYRWPTDPPGKAAAHTIPYAQHQTNVAKPAPASPVLPIGRPPDPTYANEVQGLSRTHDESLASLADQRRQGLLGYGYTEAAGGALSFDPTNPFSKAALLKQNYDRSRRSSAQTMGAGGQLYAGAFQNQQDLVNRGELQGQDALQKSLADFLARNTAGVATARRNFEFGGAQAESDRVGRIATNPLYEPTVTPPDAQTAVANPRAAAEVIKPSASHGGKKWVYRKGASGKLIPIRPA